jgi:hypothetical protein
VAKFTFDYLRSIKDRISGLTANFVKEYSFEIDGEMGLPPIRDVIRYITSLGESGTDEDLQERIMKHSVLHKKVTMMLRGKPVGNPFVINTIGDPLDSFDTLRENPIGTLMLIQTCLAHVMAKSMPPLPESDPTPAAKRTPGSVTRSSGTPGGT